jgi:hypothetical protein
MYSFCKNKGVHVFVNNKTDMPSYFEGFDVAVDTMTDIVVHRTFSERLPAPYSDCVSDIDGFGSVFTNYFAQNNLTYRQASCFGYCYQRKITDKCKCKQECLIILIFLLPLLFKLSSYKNKNLKFINKTPGNIRQDGEYLKKLGIKN